MRNTPEALAAIEKAEREGVSALIADRDGPWGDYASAPSSEQPDPGNVIEP
jgi:enoyl-CoA hydratase